MLVTEFEALSARALLAYLAVERGHRHSRASLATLLWGDDAGATALTSLRSSLRRVRNALGDEDGSPFVLTVQDHVQLDPHADLWTDVQRFEALLMDVTTHPHRRVHRCPWCIARLREAITLYRGPFLAGLRVNSIVFEEWQRLHQERYHRQAMQALFVVAEYHYRRGDFAQAEQYARRQLALEAWNEEAHQQLMRILAESGQRSAALAQYGRCRAILAAELDVSPMPATTALYEAIRRGAPVTEDGSSVADYGRAPALRHNLPRPATELIDRIAELDWLLQRLVNPAHRLTSLVGEGGVGKTRLALAAAEALAGCFADGVWFVSLADVAPCEDPRQAQREIARAIAGALGATPSERQDPLTQVTALLRNKELLLVLDNFEHLLAGVAFVGQLLRAAPNAEILVTSRQPLHFQAEHVVRLTGLATPPTIDDPTANAYPAVALFAARARQRLPHFALTPDTLAPVVRICRFVCGLPLGIELAAAWVHELSPAEIADRLVERVDWLQSEQGDLPPRHRTMQAVFEHSWSLLSPPERQALTGAAVFRGGFDRAAAVAVLHTQAAHLAGLVDKSLLYQNGEGRYDLHELLRQYVVGQCVGPGRRVVDANHSAHYLDLLREHADGLRGYAVDEALAAIRPEIDNIRSAWTTAVVHGDLDRLAACAGALRYLYLMLGLWEEGGQWLAEAACAIAHRQATEGSRPIEQMLADVLMELAELHSTCGDHTQLAAVARRLVHLGRLGSYPRARAAGHLALAKAYLGQSRLARADRHLQLALCLAQQVGEAEMEADVLAVLGGAAHFQGEKARAQRLLEQALARYRQLGRRLEEANTLSSLSHVYHNDPAKVHRWTTQRLRLAQRVGSSVDELRALHRLTILWLNVGEYAQTRDCCLCALRLGERMNDAFNPTHFLDFLGLAYHYLGDDITALRYLQQTADLCKAAGDPRALAYALHWSGQVLLARGEYSNAADSYAQAVDIRLLHHQPHLALQSQAGLARVRIAQGRTAHALALVDPIVAQLAALRQQDVEDPSMLWLNCYWVLWANNDRRAEAVLVEAHDIVQERAGRISDPAMRRTFLHNIAVHRQIIDAWQSLGAPKIHPAPVLLDPHRSNDFGRLYHLSD